MTEQEMLSKEEFLNFVLEGPEAVAPSTQSPEEAALPEGFDGFDDVETRALAAEAASSFARRLLEASGFGYAAMVQRSDLIRGNDHVARHLPERVSYWPKTTSRPYQTLLFEADLNHKQLLAIPAFKSRKMAHLDIVEDALARLVSEALEGFQRGGEGVTADVRKGRKEETLCVVSILDERDGQPVRLVCFGTQNRSTGGLETFQLTEQTRFWERQQAKDHLGLLYERQFKKLEGAGWQEAFTTTEERKQAEKLLDICTRKAPGEHDIQEGVLGLLETIAKGFGLRKPSGRRRLQAFALPSDHDIGIDPEERESSFAGNNPFGGVTLRDEHSRLLRYIIYPLKTKSDAARLRKHLEKNNRFHNVLVVYPDQDQASLELWQGQEQLIGKLRKGQGYKDAADVVNLLSRFFVVSKAKVRNPTELAQELAYRARYLRRLAVKQLADEPKEGPLRNLYNAFKEVLVHDQTEDEFADAFAQTITYGLLTARWIGNDQLVDNGERFTRQTALNYLPAASPFLNDLFKTALSVKLDEQRGRLLWLVDDIADLLDRIDVTYVFGVGDKDSDTATDPVIHFYEPFLAAYDKELKNKRGVFFTPRPVVSYIVRSVHELLQREFGLEDGLASTDTWGEVAKSIKGLKIPEGVKASDPFVCILDPATGTGTFLFECIEVIERTMKDRWCRELKKKDWKAPAIQARWKEYVPKNLLPRLVGFELMMASYAIAHLKLSMKLSETGFHLGTGDHLGLYLTNTLEPPGTTANPKLANLFETLARQAQVVSDIKLRRRFSVVIGNPPYAGLSANMSEYSQRLVESYKVVDGKELKERKIWLQDDYVKFIRVGQRFCEQSGVGVFGYVTNHGYLDNPTFRGMRQSLMETFQRIEVLDLHGNANKKERAPDGSEDKNVFEIRQGVAIGLMVRNLITPATQQCLVDRADIWGRDGHKYEWLSMHSSSSTEWTRLAPNSPFYLFVYQAEDNRDDFEQGWKITEAMPLNSAGFITARDQFVIDFKRKDLAERIAALRDATISDAEIRKRYFAGKGSDKYPPGDTRGWKLADARAKVRRDSEWDSRIRKCLYRPFDERFVYWATWMVDWPRPQVMGQMIVGDNIALVTSRMTKGEVFAHAQITRNISEVICMSSKTSNNGFVFPLWIYEQTPQLDFGLETKTRGKRAARANFAPQFLSSLASATGVAAGSDGLPKGFEPEQILQYIYSILHSPSYRSRYSEYLKVDFPRIPLPRSAQLLRLLAGIGAKLIALHLLESRSTGPKASFQGKPVVEKVSWSDNAVWIDKEHTSGFSGVQEDVWNFHVGGYQVCEKWLKDRKGRSLSQQEVEHYQKIIAVIFETIPFMTGVDEVIEKHGGWPGAFATKLTGGKK